MKKQSNIKMHWEKRKVHQISSRCLPLHLEVCVKYATEVPKFWIIPYPTKGTGICFESKQKVHKAQAYLVLFPQSEVGNSTQWLKGLEVNFTLQIMHLVGKKVKMFQLLLHLYRILGETTTMLGKTFCHVYRNSFNSFYYNTFPLQKS